LPEILINFFNINERLELVVVVVLACRDASVVDPEWLYDASPPSFQTHCRQFGRLHAGH